MDPCLWCGRPSCPRAHELAFRRYHKNIQDTALEALMGLRRQERRGPPNIICHWCANLFVLTLKNACPRCGTAIDNLKSYLAAKREKKGYLDIVRDNAYREHKPLAKVMKEVRLARNNGVFEMRETEIIRKKLNLYLRKRGIRSSFNGR